MTINTYANHKELIPDDGMVLTMDGNDWTTSVSMPLNADHTVWYEIEHPQEEVNK